MKRRSPSVDILRFRAWAMWKEHPFTAGVEKASSVAWMLVSMSQNYIWLSRHNLMFSRWNGSRRNESRRDGTNPSNWACLFYTRGERVFFPHCSSPKSENIHTWACSHSLMVLGQRSHILKNLGIGNGVLIRLPQTKTADMAHTQIVYKCNHTLFTVVPGWTETATEMTWQHSLLPVP